MAGLSRAARRFLETYGQEYAAAKLAAEFARSAVERTVKETGALVHVIGARAKGIDSLRGKLRRKEYKRPAKQLTDLIGVRVITYYQDAVDPIVQRLRAAFEINNKESTDKRLALGLRNFGYRSVHLIARLKPGQMGSAGSEFLRNRWFEIQIRSILEHAWAEIEHEIVYKSGTKQSDEFTRRFAALAGTLELLDGEFLALRQEINVLIAHYESEYRNNLHPRTSFDVARLLGFLEATIPGRSWRQAVAEGRPFGPGLENSCVDALKAAGLGTPASLREMFQSREFRGALRSFAALQGIAPADVSHLASVVLAVAVKDIRIIHNHFPEMKFDPPMVQFVEKRAAR